MDTIKAVVVEDAEGIAPSPPKSNSTEVRMLLIERVSLGANDGWALHFVDEGTPARSHRVLTIDLLLVRSGPGACPATRVDAKRVRSDRSHGRTSAYDCVSCRRSPTCRPRP